MKPTSLLRAGAHAVLGNRHWLKDQLDALAPRFVDRDVLEIGSGKPVDGGYPYSMTTAFPGSRFVMSDIDASFGHQVIDLTDVGHTDAFDLVLCISVLEHIPSFHDAVAGIHQALRPGGTAFVAVPYVYPLHDEPHDFWRFTEHGLRLMFDAFDDVTLRRRGPRLLPSGLSVTATKPADGAVRSR